MESTRRETAQIEAAAGDVLRVVQVTDSHIMSDPSRRFEGMDTAASLRAVLDAVLARPQRPDCLLATGDLVNEPSPRGYARFLEVTASLPLPLFCLPGNHDDPAMMRSALQSPGVSTPGTVAAGAWRLVLLDDFRPGTDAGRLEAAELQRLEQLLDSAREQHVLVAVHHHPVSIGSPWMDDMILENADEFFAVLDQSRRVRAVIFGHIHQEFAAQRRGIPLLGTPSTCVQFLPGSSAYGVDHREPGFRELLLGRDGDIETRVVRVAMPSPAR